MFTVRPQRDGAAGGHTTGWGRGTELAITPLVFVGMGYGIDHLAGTRPLFTLVVSAVGITGTMAKLWLGYDRDMREQEQGKPWTRGSASTQPALAAGAAIPVEAGDGHARTAAADGSPAEPGEQR